MFAEPYHSAGSVFSADRRDDITITVNEPIAEMLGDEASSFADFLTKAGAAAISPYPELAVTFSAGRLYGAAKPVMRHKYEAPNAVGPLVEQALRGVAEEAYHYLQGQDPDAFITVIVTSRETPKRRPSFKVRSQYHWWRSDQDARGG